MKNMKLFALIPLMVVTGLMGCSNSSNGPAYQEDFLYNEPVYEPIELAKQGTTIDRIEIIGIPYTKQLKAAAFDDYDVCIRAWYKDNTTSSVPFKIKNIPIDYRHYFGELGEHSIELLLNGNTETFEFNIVENPEFKGYNCYYYDRNKKLIYQEVVGYYQTTTYAGPELPDVEEDIDYQYIFRGWNHNTTYVNQDMQYLATYEKVEKRFDAAKPYHTDHIGITGLVNQEKTKGSALFYLGRVKRVAVIHSEAVELNGEDIELSFESTDYSHYWSELTQDIVKYAVEYKVDPDYNTKLYGEISEIVTHPTFADEFDSRYGYKGIRTLLEDGYDGELSSKNPFDGTYSNVKGYLHNKEVISKDSLPGFYRLALVKSFDVYLDVSYNRLAKDVYEVGTFHSFVLAPTDDIKLDVQHSYDGEFGSNFDNKLEVNTKTLYYMADMIDWSAWAE